jgi:hypothetical protein
MNEEEMTIFQNERKPRESVTRVAKRSSLTEKKK